jgi:hypothetical protein
MAAVHPIEVLDDRLRGLLEPYESAVSDAVDPVTGKFSGEIAGLIEQFGAQELEINLKYYPITVLPKNLHQAFGPVSALSWQDEELGHDDCRIENSDILRALFRRFYAD